jgi:hypothetical protein
MKKETKIALGLGVVLILGLAGYFLSGSPSLNTEGVNNTAATSSEELVTNYFGNRVDADFNRDGKVDSAFIITQTGSGSGTFYYLAHTLGGEAIFLGDRIAPQTTEWKNGEVIVNYADRKPTDPMTTRPSVGVSRYFKAEGNTLVEVKKTSASSTTSSTGQKCAAQGGTWSEQYKECTGVGESSCKAIGGTFNECASPCRNDPKAQACIMMCVSVCTL